MAEQRFYESHFCFDIGLRIYAKFYTIEELVELWDAVYVELWLNKGIKKRKCRCGLCQNSLTVCSKIRQESFQNPSKILPKSIKMVARSGAKGSWKASRFQERLLRAPSSAFLEYFSPFGQFLESFWSQLGAKGLLKSVILASRYIKIRKSEVQEGVPKKAWI